MSSLKPRQKRSRTLAGELVWQARRLAGSEKKVGIVRFVVLPGDGIGPEIAQATVEVLALVNETLGLGIAFERHDVGLSSLKATGTTFPASVMEACKKAEGVVLGPISHSDYPPGERGGVNISAQLRTELDLYANVRPSRSRPGLPHFGRTPMDLVIVRENTEGFYSDRNMHLGTGEFMPSADIALSVRKVSAHASRRIAQAAFELARRRRGSVTSVHKVNVLKVSDALFLREVRKVASVDALVANPQTRTFDLGGPLGTKAFTAALRSEVSRRMSRTLRSGGSASGR